MPLDPAAYPTGNAKRVPNQDAAEQPAQHAAQHGAYRHDEPRRAKRQGRRRCSEVMVVADDRQRRKARGDNGADHKTGRAHLERPAQFLDRKNDTGERRIERRGDTGGGPGEQKAGLPVRREATKRRHDGAADLDGRPFTPGGGAA